MGHFTDIRGLISKELHMTKMHDSRLDGQEAQNGLFVLGDLYGFRALTTL